METIGIKTPGWSQSASYRGKSGPHGGLKVMDNLLQQRGTQIELVSIDRRLQAAGKLLPRP